MEFTLSFQGSDLNMGEKQFGTLKIPHIARDDGTRTARHSKFQSS